MKLSEAIRKGCEMSTPIKNHAAVFDEEEVHACALGAAMLAVEGKEEVLRRARVAPHVSRDLQISIKLTLPGQELTQWFQQTYPTLGYAFGGKIVGLNDRAVWSREEIADWLEEQGL